MSTQSESSETRRAGSSLSAAALSDVFLQLSMLLEAGIAADDAAELLAADAQTDTEKTLYKTMLSTLDEGGTLAQALAATGRFPAYSVSMVEMGEKTGATEAVLRALSGHYDREDSLRSSLRSAVAYPCLMAAVMLAILAILLVKVIPIFSSIYTQLNLELSGAAAVLLRIGQALSDSFWIVLAVLIVIIVAVLLVLKQKGSTIFAKTKLSQDMAAGRTASSVALMLRAGMDLPAAVETAADQTTNPILSQKLRRCSESLLSGETLYDALEKEELFSARYRRMLRVGGRMGGLDAMFEEVAGKLTADAEQRLDRRIACIEPVMVVVLAVLAGLILLSVMLPLLGILSAL